MSFVIQPLADIGTATSVRHSASDAEDVARHLSTALGRLKSGEPLVVSLAGIEDATVNWLEPWLPALVSPARLAHGRDHLITLTNVTRELEVGVYRLLQAHRTFVRLGDPDYPPRIVGNVTKTVQTLYDAADLGPQRSPQLAEATDSTIHAVGDIMRRIMATGAITRHRVDPHVGMAYEYRTRAAIADPLWTEDLQTRVVREDGDSEHQEDLSPAQTD